MEKELIDRLAVVQEARWKGRDLLLILVLNAGVSVPDIDEPVLELTLSGCEEKEAVKAAVAQLCKRTLWEVVQRTEGGRQVVVFEDDIGEIACIRCQQVMTARRPFGEAEWRDLVLACEKWAQQEQAEAVRLRHVLQQVKTALHQRYDRAQHLLSLVQPHSERATQETAKAQVLREVIRVLNTWEAKQR